VIIVLASKIIHASAYPLLGPRRIVRIVAPIVALVTYRPIAADKPIN